MQKLLFPNMTNYKDLLSQTYFNKEHKHSGSMTMFKANIQGTARTLKITDNNIIKEAISLAQQLGSLENIADFCSVHESGKNSDTDSKILKIYIHNPVIDGHFLFYNEKQKKYTKKILGSFAFDLLFAIYREVQQWNWSECPGDYELITAKHQFDLLKLKEIMNITNKDYKTRLIKAMKEIKATQIVLCNYRKYNRKTEEAENLPWFKTDILSGYSHDDKTITILFAQEFMAPILRHTKNFTVIHHRAQRNIRSSYGKKLYQYLHRFENIPPLNEEISFSTKKFNDVFSTNLTTIRDVREKLKRASAYINDFYTIDIITNKANQSITLKYKKISNVFMKKEMDYEKILGNEAFQKIINSVKEISQ